MGRRGDETFNYSISLSRRIIQGGHLQLAKSNGNTLNFAAIPDFLPLCQAGKGKSSKLSQPQAGQYIQGDTL